MKTLQVKKLSDKAILPVRNFSNDAGVDLFASEDIFIPIGATVKIPTDIAVNIEPGYWGLVCDRSSMSAKGLRTGAGVIDHGYSGHLCVVMHNLNNEEAYIPGKFLPSTHAITHNGQGLGYKVRAGDKVAQLVVQPVSLPSIEEVLELPTTERGSRGFGSSGV